MRALLLSSLVAVALVAQGLDANGSPSCPTKREARTKAPRAHLYWHGPGRCWDDRNGRRPRYRDPVFPRIVAQAEVPESYEPILLVPGDLDALMRFAPWEQRITGNLSSDVLTESGARDYFNTP